MISKSCKKYMYKGFMWGHYLSNIPYEWSPEEQVFACTKSKLRKCFWYFNILFTFVLEIFLCVRLGQNFQLEDEVSVVLRSYLGLSVTFLLFVLGLQVTLLRAYEELPAIIQKYINFINYFQEKYMLPAELPQKKMFFLFEDFPSFFLTTMYYNAIITTFLVTSMGYFHPEHPIFPTSLAESPKNLHFVIYPLQMILTGYAISSMFALLLIFGYPMVPLLFYGLVILLEMRPGRKYYLSLDSLRSPYHFFKVYRNFQVLMKHDLPFYGAFVLPSCQFLFIICAICSTHGAIRMTGIFSLMLFSISIMCLTFLGGFFSLLGSYDEFSRGTMLLWKGHLSRQGSLRQRLRSLSPIRVNVGEFYYADKGMVLTMYAVIFENTVNLLVST